MLFKKGTPPVLHMKVSLIIMESATQRVKIVL